MYKYLEKPSKAESSRRPCGRFSNKTILTVGTVNKNILISIPHLIAKRFNVDDSFQINIDPVTFSHYVSSLIGINVRQMSSILDIRHALVLHMMPTLMSLHNM